MDEEKFLKFVQEIIDMFLDQDEGQDIQSAKLVMGNGNEYVLNEEKKLVMLRLYN